MDLHHTTPPPPTHTHTHTHTRGWMHFPLDAWMMCCAGASGSHQAVWSARDPAHATRGEERTNLTALQSQSHCHLQPLPSMYQAVCVYGCVSMYTCL